MTIKYSVVAAAAAIAAPLALAGNTAPPSATAVPQPTAPAPDGDASHAPAPSVVAPVAHVADPGFATTPAPIRRSLGPFAPQLSAQATIASPNAWKSTAKSDHWAGLIEATPATRQAARWAYAKQMLGMGRGAEALGALEVMAQDEPDLALVPSYQLAMGAVLTMLDRPTAAVGALSAGGLSTNPEACAWRMLAFSKAEMRAEAIGQIRCAIPALSARPVPVRTHFLTSVAKIAVDAGQPALVMQLLGTVPMSDPAANVLRGRAQVALGHVPQGKALLSQVTTGSAEVRLDAELSLLEQAATEHPLDAKAMQRLQQIRFIWRGGDVEKRAVSLRYALARREHDLAATLEAGATLFRYFPDSTDRPTLVAELHQALADVMAPSNTMPLDRIAGLYWDYRDLSPAAADGDLLVSQFADRLQAAGLYERAAELLDYQLLARTKDIAQGPLSARVATLFILAGKPDRALAALRNTDGNTYPDTMVWDRNRVAAVALDQLGSTDEAMAALQDVPDGAAIKSEIYWKHRNWQALASASAPLLANPQPMTDVMQARVLRYAIALAMLGNADALARLHGRFGPSFAKLPTAPAFEALTASVGEFDPATIVSAMAALPSTSPAGDTGDLMDAAPAVVAKPVLTASAAQH